MCVYGSTCACVCTLYSMAQRGTLSFQYMLVYLYPWESPIDLSIMMLIAFLAGECTLNLIDLFKPSIVGSALPRLLMF